VVADFVGEFAKTGKVVIAVCSKLAIMGTEPKERIFLEV